MKKIIFVADAFAKDYPLGGAELTTEAILKKSKLPIFRIRSHELSLEDIKNNLNAYWIFGNFYNIKEQILLYISQNLEYSVIEYDYKYCSFRSSEVHKINTNTECNCHNEKIGKIVSIFFNAAKHLFWMSESQKNFYLNLFPFLSKKDNIVLSSVFDDRDLLTIESLETSIKNDKWLILGSNSLIKNIPSTIEKAKDLRLNFEIIKNLPREELLKKMSVSKGLMFLPLGKDTCPRLTIEAKLLGCELITNENVQHAEEEWFKKDKKQIIEYLKSRPIFFWNIIYKDICFKEKKENKFLIIVPMYNVEKWIEKNFRSISNQKYKNFECIFIDDVSSDDTINTTFNLIKKDSRFKLLVNKEKKFALENIYNGINILKKEKEDIVVTLDGDDWFYSDNTLEILNNVYNETNCWMTYGSYAEYPSDLRGKFAKQIPNNIIKNNTYRESEWSASHLRTFKVHLWENISKEDLLDSTGKFYRMTWDLAFMMPMLEMASERAIYIPELLYAYNRENPLNDDKINNQLQLKIEKEIRAKKKYLRSPYTTCNILGPEIGVNNGLGNQLFCVAAALSYSKENKAKPIFPQLNEKKYENYKNNIFKKLSNENIPESFQPLKEKNFSFNKLEKISSNVKLDGYFQSYKYFEKNKEYILDCLNLEEYKETLQKKYLDIHERTSLHIRRGDYVNKQNFHNLLGVKYYENAVAIIKANKLAIFSDDIEWCKENIKLCEDQIFIEKNLDYEDLILMSMCDNNIIANSTFSWWAAWLNNNQKKVIIAPKKWFGEDYKDNLTEDLLPKEWITI